ncbi:hypothetical protein BJ878DRAFT_86711 [Calycina marina]|uniref:Uncharacterized protein n=1 Tax=Calycina marina TaxID=1763456 RepID=A0A9P7Z284_9HELO|nr:hypothetical protein BJ878DRAFT_86711 [Calycina marina]
MNHGAVKIDRARASQLKISITQLLFYHKMATPTTPKSPKRSEYDTIKLARFFDAFGSKENDTSIGQIHQSLDFTLPPGTARGWLSKRDLLGSPAFRDSRKLASRLGRKTKVSASDIAKVRNSNDPLHEQPHQNNPKRSKTGQNAFNMIRARRSDLHRRLAIHMVYG